MRLGYVSQYAQTSLDKTFLRITMGEDWSSVEAFLRLMSRFQEVVPVHLQLQLGRDKNISRDRTGFSQSANWEPRQDVHSWAAARVCGLHFSFQAWKGDGRRGDLAVVGLQGLWRIKDPEACMVQYRPMHKERGDERQKDSIVFIGKCREHSKNFS